MQGILYQEDTIWHFLFVSGLLGGGAAWMTGRACAQTWRTYPRLVLFLLVLGIGVRFIHHALFWVPMFSRAVLRDRHDRAADLRHARLQLHPHKPDGDAVLLALREGFTTQLETQEQSLRDFHRFAPLPAGNGVTSAAKSAK